MLMDRIYDVVYRPYHYTQLVLASFFLVAGCFLVFATFAGLPPTEGSVRQVLTHPVSVSLFAVSYLFSSVSVYWGTLRPSRKGVENGLYVGFLATLFTVISIWIVNGLYPLNWLSLSALCCICGILWLRARWEKSI